MVDSKLYIKSLSININEQLELHKGLRVFVVVQDFPEHIKQDETTRVNIHRTI